MESEIYVGILRANGRGMLGINGGEKMDKTRDGQIGFDRAKFLKKNLSDLNRVHK